jgi:hydrogenase maturation protein HypF
MKPPSKERLKLTVRGAVQGVGFRPFVCRLATELEVAGWVNNTPQGVFIEAEGSHGRLETFLQRLEADKPPRSSIQSMESRWLRPAGYKAFEIRESQTGGDKTATVLPDLATCPECLQELFDPSNRRHRYPFTNCTHCGPRFSIIEALPYDRANTAMKKFGMCPRCQAEYDDPANRRFHAQPNACPVCGPRLSLLNPAGETLFGSDEALLAAAHAIRQGEIVAVKGMGGYHLMVDARSELAIGRLRARKRREEKPFALMFPGMDQLKTVCEVSPLEEQWLLSPEAPMVLLRKQSHSNSHIAATVAPGNPDLGIMLPANPLHHLLMAQLDFPVVATSGNLSNEPICLDEAEALERLQGIADWFLAHDRPVVRPVDDSILRVVLGREMMLRRARGFAPLPVPMPIDAAAAQKVLAVGAHLKNSIALAAGDNVFISQHIGDLETEPAHRAFRRVIDDFQKLYETRPEIIAADLHPDYLSTRFADQFPAKRHVGVQHHVAHVLSCIAENEIPLPALGVAWDGTGWGTDGTVWGGEFFTINKGEVRRVAHLRPFPLPGSHAAVREPRRAGLGLLYEMFGPGIFGRDDLPPVAAFSEAERTLLPVMFKRKLNCPRTSSIGRLFDAVTSLLDLRQKMDFEGQAAMELEYAIADGVKAGAYDLPLVSRRDGLVLNWAPMIEALLNDRHQGVDNATIAARFHNALVEALVQVAWRMGEPRVAISGGCFQNRYLLERAVTRLREEKFQPYWHRRVPANDGGIAFGQVYAARQPMILR